MKVYITYDRYEHNEWFCVYYIGRNYDKAYESCIKEDLPSFISYGPDDCHSFQLQELEMSEYMYRKLRKWVNAEKLSDKEQDKFDDLMEKIYYGDFEAETLLFTDGCSDYFEMIRYHCGEEPDSDDYEDEEEYENALAEYENSVDELRSDDELFDKVLHEYIASTY
jgi:hypothetical protein